jgi:hypothetical protein
VVRASANRAIRVVLQRDGTQETRRRPARSIGKIEVHDDAREQR